MTRAEREAQKAAMALWREGKGPRPAPRPPHPSERAAKAARGGDGDAKPENVPQPAPPADPVARDDAHRAESRLRKEHGQLLDMLREERARNAFVGSVKADTAPPRILRSERASGLREMTAVAVASDWHVEEEVPAVKAGYRNEYNLTIADDSIERFFRAQIDLVKHHRASGKVVVRDAVCAFIGDLLTGHIHDEMVETTAMAPMETALWLKPRIIGGLQTLLRELDLRSLTVPWCYGNHGRSTPKTRIATGAEHSYEHLLGRIIQDAFAGDKRVRFAITPTPYQYVEAYDQTLGYTHGDSVGYGGGIGGIGIPLLKAVAGWDSVRYARYWHVGHFHQFRDFDRIMVNGSMIGWSPYAAWIRAAFEEPKQTFYLLDSKRGKVMVTPLWVRPDVSSGGRRGGAIDGPPARQPLVQGRGR